MIDCEAGCVIMTGGEMVALATPVKFTVPPLPGSAIEPVMLVAAVFTVAVMVAPAAVCTVTAPDEVTEPVPAATIPEATDRAKTSPCVPTIEYVVAPDEPAVEAW